MPLSRAGVYLAGWPGVPRTAIRGRIGRYNRTMNQPTEPTIAIDVYRTRRERVLAALRAAGGGVAIVPTAPEMLRNRDADYPYRHDSYFYYLTGFTEPEALLVLDASAATGEPASILFCREKNVERETWEGFRFGPEARARRSASTRPSPSTKSIPNCRAFSPTSRRCITRSAARRNWTNRCAAGSTRVRAQGRSGVAAPTAAHDLLPLLDDMRLVKDSHELAIMRRAGQISAQAHRRAMAASAAGVREYELEAELLYTFRKHGAQAPAYGSIVAAGANACVLHYPAGNAIAQDGDLILIDAACELDGYASDITRTFPASGRFTPAQRELYDIVLAAQQAAVDATRAGADLRRPA